MLVMQYAYMHRVVFALHLQCLHQQVLSACSNAYTGTVAEVKAAPARHVY
jgi:hypothetical protein